MKSQVILDGSKISTVEEFHNQVAKVLDLPEYYGKNLDALWDCLTGHIDTDIKLTWRNHKESAAALGEEFGHITQVFKDMCDEDSEFEFDLD